MTEVNAAQVARKALEILDRDGWCKFMLTDFREGSHCIGGAVNLALCGRDVRTLKGEGFYRGLAELIAEQYPEMAWFREKNGLGGDTDAHITFIAWWNNRPGTAESDVRAILEKLAAKEDE